MAAILASTMIRCCCPDVQALNHMSTESERSNATKLIHDVLNALELDAYAMDILNRVVANQSVWQQLQLRQSCWRHGHL